MSLVACWRSALRNWYLLILCAVVAAGATLYLTYRETPEYRSSLRLAVGPSPTLMRPTLVAETVDALNKRSLITTFAEIVGGRTVFAETAAELRLSTADSSRYSVSSVALPEANVIALYVQGPSRMVAKELSTAIAQRSITSIEGFYKNLAVRQLDEPSAPSDPVTPKPERDVPLAAAGGLCLGFFLGLCREYLHERRRRSRRRDPASDSEEP